MENVLFSRLNYCTVRGRPPPHGARAVCADFAASHAGATDAMHASFHLLPSTKDYQMATAAAQCTLMLLAFNHHALLLAAIFAQSTQAPLDKKYRR